MVGCDSSVHLRRGVDLSTPESCLYSAVKRLLRALLFTVLIVASLLFAARSERVATWLQQRPRPVRLDLPAGDVPKPGARRVVSGSEGLTPAGSEPTLRPAGRSRSSPASNSVDG